ncbi:uncharacterized protein LOC132198738 [Neocloeon triangulifer]|uniref:uncharacterized protein LOC132198738 n=1 Tax=Neocloeon triangulifer TaxID=2078957 RepID=UPI00286F9D81|nr:uncharacterized protein LOC132198738 [Neocloeon triangulifer]
MSGENSSFFAPRQPKLPIQEMLEEYAIPRSPVLSVQPKPANKFFPTPNAFKTPQAAKAPTTDRCNSAGSNSKVDPARKVHVSTPFRVPKSNEARSADFKLKPGSDTKPKLPANFMPYKLQQPLSSRLPKPVRAFQNITSPVGQYIHGPVVAPMIANAKPTSSPRVVGKLFNGGTPNKLTPAKAELENLNPNSALPFVNYDSSSSIKVVEHKEVSQKALPNKIKKLPPSPGSVLLKHTEKTLLQKLSALDEQGASSNIELLSDETEAATSAPPPSPEKAQPERELVVQEFSLEESHFSGCNLSGLNLSFESGIPGPAAPVETKEATGTSDGLYTLAFISDLAKKLDIKEEPVTPAKVAEPVRPIYSPISPADGETSQYEDAEMAKEPLEHSTIALWHDAESERKDHLDLDRSAKKTISDVSLLSNETEVLDTTTDDKNDTAELLNDTIEEMEKLLSMDVDYFQKQNEQDDVVEIQKEAEDMSGENSSFFAPRQPKLPIQEMLEEYAILRSPVLSVQPKPAKKFFPTPNAFKTPQAAKAPTNDRCNSAGSNSKVDPVSTPFWVPKSNDEWHNFKISTSI